MTLDVKSLMPVYCWKRLRVEMNCITSITVKHRRWRATPRMLIRCHEYGQPFAHSPTILSVLSIAANYRGDKPMIYEKLVEELCNLVHGLNHGPAFDSMVQCYGNAAREITIPEITNEERKKDLLTFVLRWYNTAVMAGDPAQATALGEFVDKVRLAGHDGSVWDGIMISVRNFREGHGET